MSRATDTRGRRAVGAIVAACATLALLGSAVAWSPLLGVWLASALVFASGPDLSLLEDKIDRIISRSRGTIGVSLIHVESGATLSVHGDERFPMASVYKLPIAIELLAQVSAGTLSLDRPIALAPSDIRACCTLSRRHPRGGVTVTAGELLELMIAESDNTASDAVLKLVGGPPVVERRMRTLGFDTINVNRYEGDINFEMTRRVLFPLSQDPKRSIGGTRSATLDLICPRVCARRRPLCRTAVTRPPRSSRPCDPTGSGAGTSPACQRSCGHPFFASITSPHARRP